MWLALALLAAVFSALAETLRKRLVRDVDPVVAAALAAGFSALTLLPVVAWTGVGAADRDFWIALVVSGGINAVAAVLVARAYRISDLSLVTPLTGLTPVFTLAVAALVLAEIPTIGGVAGVATVVFGTWLLATAKGSHGAAGPLRALWNDRGARLMLVVALLYGVSSTYDKVGVLSVGPVAWSCVLQATIAVTTGVRAGAAEAGRRTLLRMDRREWILAGLTGLATTAMMVAQMSALVVGLAGYVIAVKRVSILLTVLTGGFVFREAHTGVRLVAATVILAGLLLLAGG